MVPTIFSMFEENSASYTGVIEVYPHRTFTESSYLMLFSIYNAAAEMAIYNTNQFRMIGDYGDKELTFTVQAMQCSHHVADSIVISFKGMPNISDTDTFIINC